MVSIGWVGGLVVSDYDKIQQKLALALAIFAISIKDNKTQLMMKIVKINEFRNFHMQFIMLKFRVFPTGGVRRSLSQAKNFPILPLPSTWKNSPL